MYPETSTCWEWTGSGVRRLLSPLLRASIRWGHYELIGERCEARERWAAVAQHTQIKGEKMGPQLPGIHQDWAWVFILSPERWDNVCYARGMNKEWMFCRRQTARRRMGRSVRRIDKGATTDVYWSATAGAGSKGAAWIDVRWQGLAERATSLNKKRHKETYD